MGIYLGNSRIFNPQIVEVRDTEQENLLINRILSTYENNEIYTIRTRAFAYCTSLQSVNLPMASYIENWAFAFCTNLLSLYLGSTSVCLLAKSNAFASTPIGGYTGSTSGQYGSIYVPASLYSNYINATNWTVFSSRFVSV